MESDTHALLPPPLFLLEKRIKNIQIFGRVDHDAFFANEHYFTSEVWQLKSSHSDKTYYIHEDALKRQSPALHAMCSRSWSETKDRIYRFDEDVPEEVIICFINFAYRDNYAPTMYRQAAGMRPYWKDTYPIDDENKIPPLLLHAHVYIFADTYFMEDLGISAQRKIKLSLMALKLEKRRDRELFFDCFELMFDSIPAVHPILQFLAEFARFVRPKLRLSMHRFEALCKSSEEFAKIFQPLSDEPCKNPFDRTDEDIMDDSPAFLQPRPGARRPRFEQTRGEFRGFEKV